MAKAKAKAPATETDALAGATLVETVQDNDFSQPEAEPGPRGAAMEEQLEAIRVQRAADRAAKGPVSKKRRVTNYHDAERLMNLVKAGHTHLATPNELVDWEEEGLLPNPDHYVTGSTAAVANQGEIVPPSRGEPA